MNRQDVRIDAVRQARAATWARWEADHGETAIKAIASNFRAGFIDARAAQRQLRTAGAFEAEINELLANRRC